MSNFCTAWNFVTVITVIYCCSKISVIKWHVMQQYKENSLLHCHNNFGYVSMLLCYIICTFPALLKLRKGNCSDYSENSRHHCRKFRCLGNQAPEICAPLHNVEKQEQHCLHFGACYSCLFWSGWQVCCPLDTMSWLWDCNTQDLSPWCHWSQHMVVCSPLPFHFKEFRFWLFYLQLWVRT